MKPRILPIDAPIQELIEEIFHTGACLRAHLFLAAQAAQMDALRAEWTRIHQLELELIRALREAEARVLAVDHVLDFLCTAIAGTLLAENGNDRDGIVYLRYFDELPPSKLRRPVLGPQLEVMRTWAPSLMGPQNSPALQAYGQQLATCVIDADAAAQALAMAEGQRADFLIGPRKAFVDQLNGLRQALYGQLAEMPHRRPELNLGRDFAYHFFLRDTRNRKPSIAELEQQVERARARLRKHEAELARRLAEEERAVRQRAAAALSEAELALAAAEEARAEAAARLASLQTRPREER
jgi:hypothetical protein